MNRQAPWVQVVLCASAATWLAWLGVCLFRILMDQLFGGHQ